MAEPVRSWTAAELASDDVTKKLLISYLQEHSSLGFQANHKLKGTVKNVAKVKSKDQLVLDYNEMFETKAFKKEGEDEEAAEKANKDAAAKADALALEEKTKQLSVKDTPTQEAPKYTKLILRKGDRANFPRKGDTVSCFYVGKLQDGTVFDSLISGTKKGKRIQPLRFKVGMGNVIRGWDEGLLTMSAGEKAEFTIQPEWAYGKKGKPEAKIPPNATLIFEVELSNID